MATVYDVAKYILDKYGAMSAMKLQKLVFYSQAMSLVWDDIPLFEDDFEAWRKGPVCRSLFNAHKGKFMLDDSSFLDPCSPDVRRLTAEQEDTINAVVDSLIDLPAYRLSQMTHSEDPWKDARGRLPESASCENIISKETMQEYYAENW
jgi:prophage ps3 protein 01